MISEGWYAVVKNFHLWIIFNIEEKFMEQVSKVCKMMAGTQKS